MNRISLSSGSAVIEIEGVGPVLFERSRRARRLNISIHPFRGVRVAVPYGLSLQRGREFVRRKAGWIRGHIAKIEREMERRKAIMADLVPVDAEEAKKRLIARLDELACRHGFSYNRVFIRNQRTRWGSCSPMNNISLNIKLASLPQDLADYVILHELVHTRIRSHDRQFWKELDRLTGGAKAADMRLELYRLLLI